MSGWWYIFRLNIQYISHPGGYIFNISLTLEDILKIFSHEKNCNIQNFLPIWKWTRNYENISSPWRYISKYSQISCYAALPRPSGFLAIELWKAIVDFPVHPSLEWRSQKNNWTRWSFDKFKLIYILGTQNHHF